MRDMSQHAMQEVTIILLAAVHRPQDDVHVCAAA